MPVTQETPIASSTANGATTIFPYSFTLLREGDLVVLGVSSGVTTIYTLGVHYTVSGVGSATGSANFLVAPAAGTVITRYRDTALSRDTDYQTNGDLFADVLDGDFDRLWYALQEIFNGGKGVPNAIRVPNGETIPALPDASTRANKLLAFDSSGNPIVAIPTSGSAADVLIQIGNTASPVLGANLTGYNPALSYSANTVGGALKAFGSSASALVGAALIAFAPAYALAYSTNSIGARVNTSGHPSQTNVLLGARATNDHLLTGTIGYRTTSLGVGAGGDIGTATSAGGSNLWLGFGAGNKNREGSGNCAGGALALNANVDGDHSNAFGYQVLQAHTASVQNNGFGFRVMYSLTAGANNSVFGESGMTTATNANGVTAMGAFAFYSKTTGDFSTGFGYQVGFSETTATGGSYFGYRAGYSNTTQPGCSYFGYDCGNGPLGGQYNSGFGFEVLKALNGGEFNFGAGYWALRRLTTGNSNSVFGQQAGAFITSGSGNVMGGASAGSGITTGINNVAIGQGTTSTTNRNNTIALGFNAQPNGDNQVVLGDTNINAIRAQVTTITALSDTRDKANQRALGYGLDFINAIEITAWDWDQRGGSARNGAPDFGVIAQQLLEVQERHNAHWLGLVDTTNPERLEATPGKLLFPLIVAVQELSRQVDELRRAA